ncbi:MAG: hypothetical protein U0R17_04905 [Acidimicrobiia bacterium]
MSNNQTTHYTSASLRFRNTHNVPFCYSIAEGIVPTRVFSRVDDGAVHLSATYKNGRGLCASPVVAEFRIPLANCPQGSTLLDVDGADVEVHRHEDDIFGFGEDIVTPVPLLPEMVTGLLSSIDDHVNVTPHRDDVSPLVAVVDAQQLRDVIFPLAVKASDISRRAKATEANGASALQTLSNFRETPVAIRSMSLVH